MNPGGYMILGSLIIAGCAVASALGHDVLIVGFAAGALFGKGYGIWEERAERKGK